MKQAWIAALLVSAALLTGCQPSAQSVTPADTAVNLTENDCLQPISPDSISEAVYDALRADWDAWNALDESERMLSSSLPGSCGEGFESWSECEDFLGLSLENPLEDRMEAGTYVGMPLGYYGAPHVSAEWYGTAEGRVEWISVTAGYRNGDVRVMLTATVYGDPAETKSRDKGWSIEHERLDYLDGLADARMQISEDRAERFFAKLAYWAQDEVLYCTNIVGEPDAQTQVEETLALVMDAFGIEAG